MIGEADIEDVDSWSSKVTARTYHVQCSADVVGRTDDLLLQAVTRQPGQIYTKNTNFGDFGGCTLTFLTHSDEIWHEVANLGLPPPGQIL